MTNLSAEDIVNYCYSVGYVMTEDSRASLFRLCSNKNLLRFDDGKSVQRFSQPDMDTFDNSLRMTNLSINSGAGYPENASRLRLESMYFCFQIQVPKAASLQESPTSLTLLDTSQTTTSTLLDNEDPRMLQEPVKEPSPARQHENRVSHNDFIARDIPS